MLKLWPVTLGTPCETESQCVGLYVHCVHEKQSQRSFSTILFRTDKIFIKFGGLIPESAQDTTAVAFQTKPVKYPYLRRFI